MWIVGAPHQPIHADLLAHLRLGLWHEGCARPALLAPDLAGHSIAVHHGLQLEVLDELLRRLPARELVVHSSEQIGDPLDPRLGHDESQARVTVENTAEDHAPERPLRVPKRFVTADGGSAGARRGVRGRPHHPLVRLNRRSARKSCHRCSAPQ